MSGRPTTQEEALVLWRETKILIERADKALELLRHGKPAVLAEMVEPTLRIKDRLERDLAELERLAAKIDKRLG